MSRGFRSKSPSNRVTIEREHEYWTMLRETTDQEGGVGISFLYCVIARSPESAQVKGP